MKCPRCIEGRLSVTNTYCGGPGTTVQKRICGNCFTIFTAVTVAEEYDGRRKHGASYRAKLLRRQKKTPEE